MKNIEIVEIKVQATIGADIGNCMRDAIKLAADEWRNVRLCHNGREYTIQPNELLASCKEV
jgi:hypothetical protein